MNQNFKIICTAAVFICITFLAQSNTIHGNISSPEQSEDESVIKYLIPENSFFFANIFVENIATIMPDFNNNEEADYNSIIQSFSQGINSIFGTDFLENSDSIMYTLHFDEENQISDFYIAAGNYQAQDITANITRHYGESRLDFFTYLNTEIIFSERLNRAYCTVDDKYILAGEIEILQSRLDNYFHHYTEVNPEDLSPTIYSSQTLQTLLFCLYYNVNEELKQEIIGQYDFAASFLFTDELYLECELNSTTSSLRGSALIRINDIANADHARLLFERNTLSTIAEYSQIINSALYQYILDNMAIRNTEQDDYFGYEFDMPLN